MAGAEAFSLELWIRPTPDPEDLESGVHFFEGGTNSDFSFEGTPLAPKWYVNNTFAGSLGLTDEVWHHLAFVYDGTAGEARIYLNGMEVSYQTGLPSAINDIDTFCLGSRGGSTRFVDADFQELVMFDRVLTGTEVYDHYYASFGITANVPEPAVAILVVFGAGLLLGARRRSG